MSSPSSISSFDEFDWNDPSMYQPSTSPEGADECGLTKVANELTDHTFETDDGLNPNDSEVGIRLVPLNRRHSEFYFTVDASVNFSVSTDRSRYLFL